MRLTTSPFYSRNYGGLSDSQIAFLEPYVAKATGPILDPMAGQAHFLCQLTARGHDIRIADLNPGPLMLATLRDPRIVKEAKRLVDWLLPILKRFRPKGIADRLAYCDEWLPDAIQQQLLQYVQTVGLDEIGLPLESAHFWKASVRHRFAAAIPLLAAREIVCYTASDNLTWLKKGGLQRTFNVYPAIIRALDAWYKTYVPTQIAAGQGRLSVNCMHASDIGTLQYSPPDLIITSPPYANRLDYTRLWAPELEMLSGMFGFNTRTVKDRQVGTTVVHGKIVPTTDLELLPSEVQDALSRIRTDDLYASDTYYYPFFLNYAIDMRRVFTALGHILPRGGSIVVFVRDTVRKDVLFPVGRLVESSLASVGVRSLVEKREVIVRAHVGLRRRESHNSVHGLAQREWWMAFRKE